MNESSDRFGRIARIYAGSDAEDLVQEILLQVWRSLPSFDEKSRLGTWCYRIALNTAISWKRDRGRAMRCPPEHRWPTESLSSKNDSDDLQLLHRFLASLSEIDRAVLLMYLEDLSNQEIADSIGVSNGAIRTRISRIREQLENWEANDGEA
ncbi:MAG: RNA polymerase sigma factor [Rubripirellula sp.]